MYNNNWKYCTCKHIRVAVLWDPKTKFDIMWKGLAWGRTFISELLMNLFQSFKLKISRTYFITTCTEILHVWIQPVSVLFTRTVCFSRWTHMATFWCAPMDSGFSKRMLIDLIWLWCAFVLCIAMGVRRGALAPWILKLDIFLIHRYMKSGSAK